jgi:hypothetical protein
MMAKLVGQPKPANWAKRENWADGTEAGRLATNIARLYAEFSSGHGGDRQLWPGNLVVSELIDFVPQGSCYSGVCGIPKAVKSGARQTPRYESYCESPRADLGIRYIAQVLSKLARKRTGVQHGKEEKR